MYVVKLARVAARVACRALNGAVASEQRPDHIIFAVGHEQILLGRVVRESKIVGRSIAQRLRPQNEFLYELAFLREDLNSVVDSIANIHRPILRDVDRMEWIPEQLAWRVSGSVRNKIGVARRFSIGAPHPFEGARFGVEHDDAPIEVPIGEVNLVSLLVQIDPGRAAEDGRVRIIHGRGGRMANLQNKFPLARELDCLTVFSAVAGNPNVSGMVDEDAVLRTRPVIAGTRSAPGFEKIALGIKYENRRRGNAAFGSRGSLGRAEIILRVRTRTLQHPDMVLPIHGHPADLAHDPVVRQLFWPGRIYFECRRGLRSRDRGNT